MISTKRWIGVYLLSLIPVVNLILMFVWAFSDKTKKNEYSLRSYARANLIMTLIVTVMAVVLGLLLASTGNFEPFYLPQ
jgi:ABC-type Fe3+ transport system permease subunit